MGSVPRTFPVSTATGATVQDLYGGERMPRMYRDLTVETPLQLGIEPVSDTTPPIDAEVRVRHSPPGGAAGGFAVACELPRVAR